MSGELCGLRAHAGHYPVFASQPQTLIQSGIEVQGKGREIKLQTLSHTMASHYTSLTNTSLKLFLLFALGNSSTVKAHLKHSKM